MGEENKMVTFKMIMYLKNLYLPYTACNSGVEVPGYCIEFLRSTI
jgi:hypothetical protein